MKHQELYVVQVTDNGFWGCGYTPNNIKDITKARLYTERNWAEKTKNTINKMYNLNSVVKKVRFEVYD